jgi:hypothetical protein
MSNGAIRNKEYAAVDSGTPVNVDWLNPNGVAFKLIDVVLNLSTAATTSENITIKSITPGSNSVTEYVFDPSTSSLTSHVFRFDKDFMEGTTIGVDFPNTDADTTVILRYQENPRA